MPSLVKIGSVVLKKILKFSLFRNLPLEKGLVYDNEDDGQPTNFNNKSSLKPSAKVS